MFQIFIFRMSDIPSPSMGIATNDPKNIHDMTAFVQQSLTDMQNKFTNMSDQVIFDKPNSNAVCSINSKYSL